MKENIVVIGVGTESHLIGKAIAHLMPDDVIIVGAENVKKGQSPLQQSEPFVLNNPHRFDLRSVYEGNQFVCKGKHQYRLFEKDMGEGVLVTEIWKCQCGKVLGT